MRSPEYSTQAREGPPLPTIAAVLADAAPAVPAGPRALRAPLSLQSWPGVVHGGAVLGLFDSAAAMSASGPRVVEGRLTSSVPADTPLELECRDDAGAVRLAVLRRRTIARLRRGHATSVSSARMLRAEHVERRPTWAGGEAGWLVPTAERCLACGTANPLGLHAALRADETASGRGSTLRAPWRAPGGQIHSALAPVILDELAWWLGALVAKEGGVTNRIRVALLEPGAAWEAPLVAAGRFDAVDTGGPAPHLLENRVCADRRRTADCSRRRRSSIAAAPSTPRASSRTSARERPARSSPACSRTTRNSRARPLPLPSRQRAGMRVVATSRAAPHPTLSPKRRGTARGRASSFSPKGEGRPRARASSFSPRGGGVAQPGIEVAGDGGLGFEGARDGHRDGGHAEAARADGAARGSRSPPVATRSWSRQMSR